MVKFMAEAPHVAAVGLPALQLGRTEPQFTLWRLRRPDRPSWALRATPRGSSGPPEPAPAGRVAKLRLLPVAPTV